jgi:hypothetical protein
MCSDDSEKLKNNILLFWSINPVRFVKSILVTKKYEFYLEQAEVVSMFLDYNMHSSYKTCNINENQFAT